MTDFAEVYRTMRSSSLSRRAFSISCFVHSKRNCLSSKRWCCNSKRFCSSSATSESVSKVTVGIHDFCGRGGMETLWSVTSHFLLMNSPVLKKCGLQQSDFYVVCVFPGGESSSPRSITFGSPHKLIKQPTTQGKTQKIEAIQAKRIASIQYIGFLYPWQ